MQVLGAFSFAFSAFDTIGGTSMATPVVSGLAALWLEKDPTLTPDQLADKLRQSDTNITDSDNGLTFPRVDAKELLKAQFSRNLTPGWNLIAIPLVLENNTISNTLQNSL